MHEMLLRAVRLLLLLLLCELGRIEELVHWLMMLRLAGESLLDDRHHLAKLVSHDVLQLLLRLL